MPNIPEAVVALFATASVGAIWSSCSPDFGDRSVIDRFRQIEPKVLFAVDGYQYGGKPFDRRATVRDFQGAIPSLEKTVFTPYLQTDADPVGLQNVVAWEELLTTPGELACEPVPFDHPLWVVYSSGTTGLPKPMVHGHGGIVVEHLKMMALHVDLRPGDRFFWFTTTGWVMWNLVLGGLLTGATISLYDGNPAHPDMDVLWDLLANIRATAMGMSPAYVNGCMRAGMEPAKSHDLTTLRAVGTTGSPLPPEGYQWVYERVNPNVWLAPISGGTDPATAFVGGSPLLPVRAGEMQCRCLGAKAEAFDPDGNALVGEVGELVVTEPMPSMPLFFWNDEGNRRYQESYFDMYPGVWRHGDWMKVTARGSTIITGRSDSTLNRMGVRIGSSEIYSVVEDLPEVVDSLIIGYEMEGGQYYMPLFVVLEEGVALDAALKGKIRTRIRNTLSPRHVPDDVFAIREVPRTLNGKKLEVPIKKILMGVPLDKAVNLDSMANRDSVDYFVALREDLAARG
jgi:acetoacetyl-CoA synthetase